MSNVWFTADTHLGHDRIIHYTNRPFTSAEEMEEGLLTRFNEVLRPGDRLYHLGDVAWSSYDLGRFFSRLNTKEVHLILGNHDRKNLSEYHKWFRSVGEYKSLTVDQTRVILFHYPIRSWVSKGYGAYHLYGHVHGTLPQSGERSMDVGVDTTGFYPIHLDQVVTTLADRPYYAKWNMEGDFDPQGGKGLWDKGPHHIPS
jgi:calcineurin-like phosphoesterase family protein